MGTYDAMLRTKHLAERLNCSTAKARAWAKENKVKIVRLSIKDWRFDSADVERAISKAMNAVKGE